MGDLGLFVEQKKSSTTTMNTFFASKKQVTGNITFAYVFRTIREISKTSGSIDKTNKFGALVREFEGYESKYLFRFVEGNYKIGSGESFFQAGLAMAIHQHFLGKSNAKVSFLLTLNSARTGNGLSREPSTRTPTSGRSSGLCSTARETLTS